MSDDVAPEVKTDKKEEKKRKKSLLKKIGMKRILLFVIVVGAIGFGIMQYQENQKLKTTDGQKEVSQAQIKDTIESVKKHLIIPSDEEPVVATVNDPDALKKDQSFYKDAIKGDQVLVYQKNQRAIIYSPSRDIIVNVGGVSITGTPTSSSPDKPAQPAAQ